jgi:hypothetical protein
LNQIKRGRPNVLVEAAAVSKYLQTIEAEGLDKARCEVTDSIRQADIERLSKLANVVGKGWSENPDRYSFIRKNFLNSHQNSHLTKTKKATSLVASANDSFI